RERGECHAHHAEEGRGAVAPRGPCELGEGAVGLDQDLAGRVLALPLLLFRAGAARRARRGRPVVVRGALLRAAGPLRLLAHVRRKRAAKAPSQPWTCGKRHMKPFSSTTSSGTSPAALSSTNDGLWRRK